MTTEEAAEKLADLIEEEWDEQGLTAEQRAENLRRMEEASKHIPDA